MSSLNVSEPVRSASSNAGASVFREVAYLKQLFLREALRTFDFHGLRHWEAEIDGFARRYLHRPLNELSVFEIGFGPRPQRLMWMQGAARSAMGVDLDRPTFGFSLPEILRIARTNGVLRALKTAVRSALFDPRYFRQFGDAYETRFGRRFQLDPSRCLVSDASKGEMWGKLPQIDLIYSEDVLEHIPQASLERICDQALAHLQPGGLLLLNINVYTGITGGHVPEWYHDAWDNGMVKKSLPWGHLRDPNFVPNTYMNGLRPRDYEAMFAKRFEVLSVDELCPEFGREFLTDEVLATLPDYTESELMANNLRYVLRKPPA